MVACEVHDETVVSDWQFNTTAGAFVTVKVALHVTGGWQELVTVNVTVLPPHMLMEHLCCCCSVKNRNRHS